MKKNYSFDKISDFPYIYDSALKEYVEAYRKNFQIVSPFLELFLSKPYYLQLAHNDTSSGTKVSWLDKIDTSFSLEFQISDKAKNLTMIIQEDQVIVRFSNQEFVLRLESDEFKSYIQVIEYTNFLEDKKVTQRISTHQLAIEIATGNKVFLMHIPYDIYNYLDVRLFDFVIPSTSIVDLRRMYRNYFYPLQSMFESHLDSVLEIYEVDHEDKILLDSLTLKDGFVENYVLSTYKNGFLIRLMGKRTGDCKLCVENYIPIETIDINKEAMALYNRSRKINFE